jgi:NACalpha-BTF3-like transcription factor
MIRSLTCIIQIEDMNSHAQLSAAQQLASAGAAGGLDLGSGGPGGEGEEEEDDIPELEAAEDEGPVDETGVEAKDIELVMTQVGCSRAKAVKVLKENNGDLINASTCLSPSQPPIFLSVLFQSWQPAGNCHLYLVFIPSSCTKLNVVSIDIISE